MATEFQHAPSPGVVEYVFVGTVTQQHKFVQYSAPAPLCLIPGHNRVSGDLAVKYPMISDSPGFRLFPNEMALLKAQTRDVAPSSVQINRAGQPVNVPGLAHEIQSSTF